MDDLVEQLEKALEQSEQREAQLNDRVSALEDILYLTEANLEAAEQRGYANAMEAERKLHEDRIEELEAKLAKVTTELKVLTDVSTFMQSSAYYDKRRYQSMITDTVWSQWSKQLKFAKGTLAELKEQKDE